MEVVLKVDGSSLMDLIIDGRLGDKAEHDVAVVWTVGNLSERCFSVVARLRRGREGLDEAFGEELEGLGIPFHDSANENEKIFGEDENE